MSNILKRLFMFTGLIEAVCRVTSARQGAGSMRLTVDLGALADGVTTGESIAVNGTCLTVTSIEGTRADFDVSGETLTISTLGRLTASAPVNIEKALRPTDRLGGHIVQGHVDGIATIKAINKAGQFAEFNFEAQSSLLDTMVPKGSVAVNGISLTIAKLDRDGFSVAVIPETLDRTTLGSARIGDKVNIETDIIAKMIKKQLDNILPQRQGLTIDKLQQLGF
jgi:riboflavin synthase